LRWDSQTEGEKGIQRSEQPGRSDVEKTGEMRGLEPPRLDRSLFVWRGECVFVSTWSVKGRPWCSEGRSALSRSAHQRCMDIVKRHAVNTCSPDHCSLPEATLNLISLGGPSLTTCHRIYLRDPKTASYQLSQASVTESGSLGVQSLVPGP
jgi:hypothetical protein